MKNQKKCMHLKDNEEDIFFLYGSTGSEIFTEAVFSMKDRSTGKRTGYMRFYDPTFLRDEKTK